MQINDLSWCCHANCPKTSWNGAAVQIDRKHHGMMLWCKLLKETLKWRCRTNCPKTLWNGVCRANCSTKPRKAQERCCRVNYPRTHWNNVAAKIKKKKKNTPKCSPYVTVYTRFTKLTHFNQTLLRMALMIELNT